MSRSATRHGGEAHAQAPAPATDADRAELARRIASPLAKLVSVPFQTTWTSGIDPNDDSALTLKLQPVVPFAISDNWNIISRATLPMTS